MRIAGHCDIHNVLLLMLWLCESRAGPPTLAPSESGRQPPCPARRCLPGSVLTRLHPVLPRFCIWTSPLLEWIRLAAGTCGTLWVSRGRGVVVRGCWRRRRRWRRPSCSALMVHCKACCLPLTNNTGSKIRWLNGSINEHWGRAANQDDAPQLRRRRPPAGPGADRRQLPPLSRHEALFGG